MNEVKPPKKPLLYYYIGVVVVVLLFNLLAMPWMSQIRIQSVDYNTFLEMVDAGQVSRVEIQQQDNRILFTDQEETAVYKTGMVEDPTLIIRLYHAGVSFAGEEIKQTSLLVSLLSWILPIVIFVAVGQHLSGR